MTAGGKKRYKTLRATPIVTAKKTIAKPGEPGRVTSELVARGILPKVPRGRRKT
jgi:hypothetical protein